MGVVRCQPKFLDKWVKVDTRHNLCHYREVTNSTLSWEMSPEDLHLLEGIHLDTSEYARSVRSHIPIPPLERGGGNLNQVDSADPLESASYEEVKTQSSYSGTNLQVSSKTVSPSGQIPVELGAGMGIRPLPQGGRFFRLSQLGTLPKPVWLVEGLWPSYSVIMVAGPPKSLKSFFALDVMLHMAIGRDWNNHAIPHPTKVLYILGEGKNNLYKRVEVWKLHNKLTPNELALLEENFLTSFVMPQVSFHKEVSKLLNDLNNEGFRPELVVLDTFARAMVGREENSSKETGEAVAQMDRLREQGLTVVFLHHTVKNVSKKGAIYRGSGNLEAAIDTSFDVFRNRDSEELSIKNSNQKDDEEAAPMKFGWKKIFLDLDQKESSLVLIPITELSIHDQIIQLLLESPQSKGDTLKRVKGMRKADVATILDDMMSSGEVIVTKIGRFQMLDLPKQADPNK